MNIHTDELTVEVHVRPDELVEPIDTKIGTLRQLDAAGHIDNLSVHAWPGAITLTNQTPYSDAIDAFEQMEAWADEHGVSIQPPFNVRTTTSTFTDETQTTLRTPMMCLAVSAGEQLANVVPHFRGDAHQESWTRLQLSERTTSNCSRSRLIQRHCLRATVRSAIPN
ncbi:HTH domain-containing protein [Natrinema sp. 1APR25-10V2]|uniref:HTH domain-containing protein n=1 Tax=Natrinema sp. 1APR25-10V2 TaxID=2951081 RepID=UPI00287BA88B|nr:HTH domain-containing protein [Natrinema sp. 1APR25-10V2]